MFLISHYEISQQDIKVSMCADKVSVKKYLNLATVLVIICHFYLCFLIQGYSDFYNSYVARTEKMGGLMTNNNDIFRFYSIWWDENLFFFHQNFFYMQRRNI